MKTTKDRGEFEMPALTSKILRCAGLGRKPLLRYLDHLLPGSMATTLTGSSLVVRGIIPVRREITDWASDPPDEESKECHPHPVFDF